jgi:Zn-dependent M28 family amino/carboxypeptidase
MNLMKKIFFLLVITIASVSCTGRKNDFLNASRSITIRDLDKYDSELGSDKFMGRKPFTEGEKITVNYLVEQLKLIGFESPFDGSYFQQVPMVEINSSISEVFIAKSSKTLFRFSDPDEVAIISPIEKSEYLCTNIPLVFAGFGIVAPEYGWDDYAGLDVKDKVVIVLINDPGLYTGDNMLFKGREMTYYGRWTYKYEEAARQGAAGIIIIHETLGAGYQYTIPRKSAISPRLYMRSEDIKEPLCQFTGWLSSGAAERLFGSIGMNVDTLRVKACKRGYKGFPLNLGISLDIKNKIRYDESVNVAGIMKGSIRPDECIVYSAHWDHFGIGEKENGDSIYNGAVDNGTSMAWVLSIGKAFTQLKHKPARSVILLFPTAEEQGLLGSKYYTDHPVIPMEKTVACLNNDAILPIGRMKDVTITGYGQSTLDSLTAIAAAEQDRYITGDPDSYTGMFFRSDHFSFAAKGVPSLYAQGSTESREHGKEWAAEQKKDYIANRYHRPSDNYYPGIFNFEGIAEDAALAFRIGYNLANSDYYPEWKPGSEFKKLRTR